MLFSLLLNVAVGIMIQAVPGFATSMLRGGIDDTALTDYINATDDFDNTINVVNSQTDQGIIDRIFDLTIIKQVSAAIESIPNYLYGFTKVLFDFFGGYLGPTLTLYLQYTINGILTMMYAFLAFSLLTGRKII